MKHSLQYGDDGGFVMKAKCGEGFLPYTQKNLVDGKGKKRKFELENGKGYNYCTVDQCLKPGVIAYFRDGTITGDVPEAKLKALKNSMAKNALTADNYMPGTGIAFFVWYCGDLVKEILKDNWTPCEKTVGGGLF